MYKIKCVLIIICVFCIVINGTQSYTEDKYLPNFITLGQNYRKALGSTVVLPCKLNRTEHTVENVVAWKHDIAVLTAGMVKVTVNPRIRLIPQEELHNHDKQTRSYNLEIRDVQLIDAGNYVCQISSIIPKEIYHTLEILIPPKITKVIPTNIVIDVSQGEPIHLECHADGNPPPKIIWTRKNNFISNTTPNITSNIYEIMHADRHAVGHYKCNADNGVGQLDTREFIVNVKYSPEIEFESPIIYSGIGIETKLTCIVYGDPIPLVSWYSDTKQMLITSEQQQHYHQQIRGNFYDLIIQNVTINDLGNYSCRASNSLGEAKLSVMLSAVPKVCIFDSPTVSTYRELYNISWSVESYSPIREYQLFYRRLKLQKHSYNHHDNNDFKNEYIGMNLYNNRQKYENTEPHYYGGQVADEKWKNIVLPEKFYDDEQFYKRLSNDDENTIINYKNVTSRKERKNIIHKSSYLLRNLIPGSSYEVKIQARNDFGWNKVSQVFYFTTKQQQYEAVATPSVLKAAGVLDKDLKNLGISLINSKFEIRLYIISFLILFIVKYCDNFVI